MKKILSVFALLSAAALFGQDTLGYNWDIFQINMEYEHFGVNDFCSEWEFTKGIEGASHDKQGNIYAVNLKKQGTVGKINSGTGVQEVFLTLPEGSVGNGTVWDKKGRMYIADYTTHTIWRYNPKNKKLEKFAHEPKMNQPNDIAIAPNGTLYASDPNWKEGTGNLWMISSKGEARLLEQNIGTTNGIELSPDGKKLYVGESAQRKIWLYDIGKDGIPVNKRLFLSFDDYGLDGIRCNSKGDVYITRHGKGAILRVNPDGKTIFMIPLKGRLCSNLTIIERKDGEDIFVTMADRGMIEKISITYAKK